MGIYSWTISNWHQRLQNSLYNITILFIKPCVYMHAGIKFWKSICLLSTKNNYLKNLSFNYSYPHSSPINLPCTTQSPPPTFNPPPQPRCLCPWVLYTCSLTWPFPFFPPLSPSPHRCQFVLYFHISVSILLACLLCWLGPTYFKRDILSYCLDYYS